ncbi:MAG TPA: peptide chain release factor N(5)-glutamine methyltransferase [Edaphobacter sp.]|nr:peptide chain release factor N(5)-glutamine methyltransferase [Edaphobacter sp.]
MRGATARLAADPLLAETARRDAELLLLHVIGAPRTVLLSDPSRLLTAEQADAYEACIARRLRHEPIQYIVGTQEFYGLNFRVTPAVLIPRPETEHLVEAVLERMPHDRPVTIADIGTGSGAIAVALAHHLPLATIYALDLSPAALEVAKGNAAALGVAGRVQFFESDLLSALPADQQQGFFDAVVSNPPYVPFADATQLHPQVSQYEPSTALYAGEDGLGIYKRLIPNAQKALKMNGLLAVEIGYGQRDAVAGLLSEWRGVSFLNDLQGIPRVGLARR